jgi:hypothetical protein
VQDENNKLTIEEMNSYDMAKDVEEKLQAKNSDEARAAL